MRHDTQSLQRTLHMAGAILLGLGAVVGTGAYVTLGMAVELAGAGALIALIMAATVAFCNGQSSAFLAARHPVSGGTYVYAGRELHPWIGFLSGWLFLAAKSASAATAALGIAAYLTNAMGMDAAWQIPIALVCVAAVGLLAARQLKLSVAVTALMTLVSVGALLAFTAAMLALTPNSETLLSPQDANSDFASVPAIAHAAALIFVAFTGYGRVATLGEEVVDPQRTIPRAVAATVWISAALYGMVMIGMLTAYAQSGDIGAGLTLSEVAQSLSLSWLASILAVGATVAMLGVLLNLLLGLSRVLLAMARQYDMPRRLAHIDPVHAAPTAAAVTAAVIVGVLVLVGDIRLTWSFSALTVLLYYGVTNLAALAALRRSSSALRWMSGAGLVGCLVLAVFIPPVIWALGGVILLLGVTWRGLFSRWRL